MVHGAGIVPDRVTVTRHGMSFISVPGGRLTHGRRRPVGGPWGLPEIPVGNSPGSVEPVVRVHPMPIAEAFWMPSIRDPAAMKSTMIFRENCMDLSSLFSVASILIGLEYSIGSGI